MKERKKGKGKRVGKIQTLYSGAFCLETRRREVVLVPSMAFSCPSSQALATLLVLSYAL